MKAIIQILLITCVPILLFVGGAQAQTSSKGARPQVYSKELQEKLAQLKPHSTPLPRTSNGQVVLPKEVQEAIQRHASRPSQPPVSEEEKRRFQQEVIQRILDAIQKSGDG
jgi:hypothetical protein